MKKILLYIIPGLVIIAGLLYVLNYIYYCPPDIDRNGEINFNDLTSLSSKFGNSCFYCREDINHDRKVDSTDMNILMKNYNKKVEKTYSVNQ